VELTIFALVALFHLVRIFEDWPVIIGDWSVPTCTTVERLEAGRSRWWTFAGVRANWLLANAVRQRGSSVRIDDFYIEMKGAIAVAAMRDRRRRKRRGYWAVWWPYSFSSAVNLNPKRARPPATIRATQLTRIEYGQPVTQ
jgi:hypothetical protein